MTTISIKDSPVYQNYYNKYQNYLKKEHSNISFEGYLSLIDGRKAFLQGLENFLEGNGGDGIKGNLLNQYKYTTLGNSSLYQSVDDETFYDFDFDNGTVTIYDDISDVAELLGLDGENVDTLEISISGVKATDYTFGNLDDGQDSTTTKKNSGKYGVTFETQEFDLHYILDVLLQNPDDPQYQIACEIFEELNANLTQWLPDEAYDEIIRCEEQYGVDSVEYKALLKELILKYLDDAQEWREDHSHVEYNPQTSTNTGSTSSSGTTSTDSTTTNEVPEYNKNNVIYGSGYSSYYSSETNLLGEWDGAGDTATTKTKATNQMLAEAENLFNALANSLKSQIGSAWTAEMDSYLVTIKGELIKLLYIPENGKVDENIIDNGQVKSASYIGGLDLKKHNTYRYVIDVQKFCDKFFELFDAMCKSGGKTQEEIDAEKEEQAKYDAGYNSLYNMDFGKEAKDAGIQSTYTVVLHYEDGIEPAIDKAEEILDDLKAQIRSELKGKVPEDKLDDILENATDNALSNYAEWLSDSGNDVNYVINTENLISEFEANVKAQLEEMGYPKE